MEQASRKRTQKNRLKKVILNSVKIAGVLTIAIAAPNVIGAMGKLGMMPSARQGEVIRRSLNRHVRTGLLLRSRQGYELTDKGASTLRALEVRDYKFNIPKRWDGKWRVLMFDIPERRKKTREKIRLTLSEIGFIRLQDSVWVYPYDCEDLLALIKIDLQIGKDLVYLIAEEIEGENSLLKLFSLSR